ncbi:hypothetical protein UFOVP231_81 [uncultured Caudovirales phage]|uniref:Uncharacterized protein n=1 Tax=uncultured Caudovirales phage TaxID=2100421 RepID=A0A6J7WVM4_9CAUD|nr:hypothetical protein UFOVP231_81 [uncultured Caudovirales phage]
MTSQDIARKWVALLGTGIHPDTTGGEYTPPLPKDMRIAYDKDMDQLFKLVSDPYAVILVEMELAGLV